jgi:cob(I)alamin adenosyltransferase
MIYTKTGDKGTTSLVGGTRVPKYDIRIETYGTVDELNSYLAVVAECAKPISDKYYNQLKTIQQELFVIQTLLATEDDEIYSKLPQLPSSAIEQMECNIDEMEKTLPRLQSFVIPGGSLVSAHAHVARCICRRSERLCVKLAAEQTISADICIYLNRLSDYLFLLSRMLLYIEGKEECYWHSGK